MFSDRRYFFKKILNLSLFTSFFSGLGFLKFIGFRSVFHKNYKINIVTELPKSMTLKEYRRFKESYIDVYKINKLISLFKEKSIILYEKNIFKGNKSEWRVVFKNYESYNYWLKLTRPYFNKPVIRSIGLDVKGLIF